MTVVIPPWITLTPEQQELYSKLRACQQLFQVGEKKEEEEDEKENDVGLHDDHQAGSDGPPRTCKLLTLLRTRELVGSSSSSLVPSRGGRYPCAGGMVVTPDRLAKVGAWNRRRLQNMILAVGPGTPASFIMQGDELGVGDEDEDEDEEGEEEDARSLGSMYSEDSENEEENEERNVGVEVMNEDDGEEEEGNEDDARFYRDSADRHDDAPSLNASPVLRERTQRLTEEEEEEEEEADEQTNSTISNRGGGITSNNLMMSSMIHGGCINTASWLDSGWRISTAHQEDVHHNFQMHGDHNDDDDQDTYRNATHGFGKAVKSVGPYEYPTQLVTSGDDKLLRFWDVSESMGSISPWPGGDGTRTPYSSFPSTSDTIVDVWRSKYRSRCIDGGSPAHILPGAVRPLATLNTGHRGNVFHVSTIPHSQGKLATCGADGFLRLHDVENDIQIQRQKPSPLRYSASTMQSTSSVIISPQYHSENNSSQRQVHVYPGGVTLVRNSPPSRMCFSHHFLSSNVGLVCSEGGLLHFDLRLPPRSQKRGSLIPELRDCCRACVPWRFGVEDETNTGCNGGELESAFVFAGGNHTDVGLYDLRMTGSSSSLSSSGVENLNNAIQKYRPTALHGKNGVAISGIDLSKDKREILVSYESDHIYAFPIFGGIREPTLQNVEEAMTSNNGAVSDYASYGAHLNQLTFLKMARYAGPNDDYICTGSDSGHAWIYEKATGAVVSLIKADTSTCNGILPHPTLPYFISYGIDSTAKLWRATTPVDMNVDDSDLGRFHHSQRVEYKKSIVVDRWKKHKKRKIQLRLTGFFPDEQTDEDNDFCPGFFHGMVLHSRIRDKNSFIGNDLMRLNEVLTKNYFQCARSESMGSVNDDSPVKGAILPMKIRVNLMKLHHQANRTGLEYDEQVPWILKPKQHLLLDSIVGGERGCGGDLENNKMVSYGCVADFIPDNPSDWLPFNVPFASPPLPAGMPFNSIHKEFLYDLFANERVTLRDVYTIFDILVENDKLNRSDGDSDEAVNTMSKSNLDDVSSTQQPQDTPKANRGQFGEYALAWDLLLQTVSFLKEAGNAALKASLPYLAARRYDKAINYCAIAYLKFPVSMVDFLSDQHLKISRNSGYECSWTELLQTLIMVRLNLAMVLLTPEIQDAKGAVTQAEQSLRELKPFATKKGLVLMGKKLASKRTDEPDDTYVQAKALQAKAYFRLGSAQLDLGDFEDAVKSLEHSVVSTSEANMKVDAGLMRKLNKAKNCRNDKIERQRKKFKLMFGSSIKEDNRE